MPIDYLEFSKKVKEKYPQYKDVDDKILAQKMIKKFPEYNNQVSFDSLKKKEESVSLSSEETQQSSLDITKKDQNLSSGSSGQKPDGEYVYSKRPGVKYKKQGGKWYINVDGTENYQEIVQNAESRSIELDKNALPAGESSPSFVKDILDKGIADYSIDKAEEATIKRQENAKKFVNSEDFSKLISGDLVGMEEETVVPVLRKTLNDLGYGDMFNVEQSGVGDNLVITNNKSGKSTTISLDNFTTEKDNEYAKHLSGFIKAGVLTGDYSDQSTLVYSLKSLKNELLTGNEPHNLTKRQEAERAVGIAYMNSKYPDSPLLASIDKEISDKEVELNKLKRESQNEIVKNRYVASAVYNDEATRTATSKINTLHIDALKLKEQEQKINQKISEGKNLLETGQISQEDYDRVYVDGLKQDMDVYKKNVQNINDRSIEYYDDLEFANQSSALNWWASQDKGTFVGGIGKEFIEGAESVLRFMSYSGEDWEKGSLAKGFDAFQYTSDEYSKSENRGIFEKGMFALSNSLGVMTMGLAGGPKGVTGAFFASSYMNMKDQMNTPEFKGVSEGEKVLFSSLYGATIGALEKFGLTKAFSKTPIGGTIARSILGRTIVRTPANASSSAFRKTLLQEAGDFMKRVTFNTAKGMIAEGGTEFIQTGAEWGLDKLYNELKGKEYFSVGSVTDMLSDAGEAFVLGAIGGGIMGAVSQSTGVEMKSLTPVQMSTMKHMVENPHLMDAFEANLIDKVISNKMTQEEADTQITYVREAYALTEKMPDSVSPKDQNKAFRLLAERVEIEKSIKGKDKALVVKQQERIDQINAELNALSSQTESSTIKGVESDVVIDGKTREEALKDWMNEAAKGLPVEKIKIEYIKDGDALKSNFFNNPEAVKASSYRSASKLLDRIKNGESIINPILIHKNDDSVTDGLNRLVAQIGAGQTEVDVVRIDSTLFDKEEATKKLINDKYDNYNKTSSAQLQAHIDNGGSTFTANGENKIGTDAASVSIFPERSEIIEGQITQEQLDAFKEKNKDILEGNDDVLAIGTWFDKESGKTYLDISAVVPKDSAVELGKAYNQKAVFDLKNLEEINTEGTGESVEGLKSESERIQDIRNVVDSKSETQVGVESEVKEEKSVSLPKEATEKLTIDDNGDVIFHHYSSQKRDVIKPSTGTGSLITSKEEQAAISKVGGVAMLYTQEGHGESGTGNVRHTVKIPANKVYDLSTDPDNLYDEAKAQFNEQFPGQAFGPNDQAAWVSKVANEKGYDVVIAKWRGGYRAQTTKELTPSQDQVEFKKQAEQKIEVGDKVKYAGQEVEITGVRGNLYDYKGKGSWGTFNINTEKPGQVELISKASDTQRDVKGLEAFSEFLDELDKKLDDFSKGALSMGLPIVVAKGALNAARLAVNTATTVSDVINAAIKYVKSTDWYENLSEEEKSDAEKSVQRLFTDEKKQKSAPSVEKLGIKPKKGGKVTITISNEAKALKEDLAREARASRKARIFAKKTMSEVSSKIKSLADKGGLTSAQVSVLMDKFSKINVDSQDSINSFLQYADKLFEKASNATVIKDSYKALKEDLRKEASVARRAKYDTKNKIQAISDKLKSMATAGKINSTQSGVLIKKLSELNMDSPITVQKFLEYAGRVFDKAEYSENLSKAYKERARINRLLESKNDGKMVAVAKEFSKLDPFYAEDLDQYMEVADSLVDALKPTIITMDKRSLKIAAPIGDLSTYISNQKEAQDNAIRDLTLSINQDLVDAGVISEDMSLSEIMDIVNGIEDGGPELTKDQSAYLRAYAKSVIDNYVPIAEHMIRTGVDPITGESVDIDKKGAKVIKGLIGLDVSDLSHKDMIDIINGFNSFVTNQSYGGLEAVLKTLEGKVNLKYLISKGYKANSISLTERLLNIKSKYSITKGWLEQMSSVPMLMEYALGSMEKARNLLSKMGWYEVYEGVTRANLRHTEAISEFVEFAKKNNKDWNTVDNVYEVGVLASLMRTIPGTDSEIKKEFDRKKAQLLESRNRLRNDEDKVSQKKADAYDRVFSKLDLENAESVDDVIKNADSKNIDNVSWWIDNWSRFYKEGSEISESVFNTVLGADVNYTPIVYKTLDNSEKGSEAKIDDKTGAYAVALGLNDKKTGVLMESNKTPGMENDRYIDLDFYVNNDRALKGMLMDIETAGAIKKVKGFLSSKEINKIFRNKRDLALIKRRVYESINKAKNKSIPTADELKNIDLLISSLGQKGTVLALAGPLQTVKQTAPASVNTLINSGNVPNIADAMSMEFLEFAKKTGLSIISRGLDIMSNMDSAEKLLTESASSVSINNAMRLANSYADKVLKMFLSNPDVVIAQASWVTYYKQSLKKQGLDTNIDWSTHKVNEEAKAYANHSIDRQMYISDSSQGGKFMTSQIPVIKIIRNGVMPFSSFIINQKTRMVNDMRILSSSTATREDRWQAMRSLGGLMAEMSIYHGIGVSIRFALRALADYITGHEPDEEELERREKRNWAYMGESVAKDIFSPSPFFDYYLISAMNKALDRMNLGIDDKEIDKKIKEENEKRLSKGLEEMDDDQVINFKANYITDNKFIFPNYADDNNKLGLSGIAVNAVIDSYTGMDLYKSGEYTEERYGEKKTYYIPKRDREVLLPAIIGKTSHTIGVALPELSTLERYCMSNVKKSGMSEKRKRMMDKVTEEIGKTEDSLKDYELEIIKSTSRKADAVAEELKYIEKRGGFTTDEEIKLAMDHIKNDGSRMTKPVIDKIKEKAKKKGS